MEATNLQSTFLVAEYKNRFKTSELNMYISAYQNSNLENFHSAVKSKLFVPVSFRE